MATEPVIVVIDDLRSFRTRNATYARTSRAGINLLEGLSQSDTTIDELWLDHDLGGDDTIKPVVYWLLERAHAGRLLSVHEVFVHTSNPVGGDAMAQQLRRHYSVRRVDALSVGLVAEN